MTVEEKLPKVHHTFDAHLNSADQHWEGESGPCTALSCFSCNKNSANGLFLCEQNFSLLESCIPLLCFPNRFWLLWPRVGRGGEGLLGRCSAKFIFPNLWFTALRAACYCSILWFVWLFLPSVSLYFESFSLKC